MLCRCPEHQIEGIAVLRNYKIAFTRFSKWRRKCGVADVVQAPGNIVWGVLYLLSDSDLKSLDQSEGADYKTPPNAYDRVTLPVLRDGNPAQPIAAQVYVVPSESRGLYRPNKAYKRLLIDGARAAGIPEEYISELEKIEEQESLG